MKLRGWVPLFLLAAAGLIIGCAAEPPLPIGKTVHEEPGAPAGGAKGQESPLPEVDQKADSWRSPTIHETIAFGQTDRATISEAQLFHAWDFTLTEPLEVRLEATPLTTNLDPVLYVYKWDDHLGSWGSFLYRNDDFEGQLRAVIAQPLDQGLRFAQVTR